MSNKIPYPKYTREQNLSCKLTDEDIAYIRYKYLQGDSKGGLARLFNVSCPTIRRWVDEDFRQREIKDKSLYRKIHNIKTTSEKEKEYKLRKLKIQLKEFLEYKKDRNRSYREWIKKDPEKRKRYYESHRKYWSKNRERLNNLCREKYFLKRQNEKLNFN